MSHHRGIPVWLIPLSCLVATVALAQDAPEKALKFHEALLNRPHSAALFDRFFGAWLDEQPIEALDGFLKARAASGGGQNWTVLATYQLRRGNEDEALAALAKGIDAVPDDPALLMERAKLRLRRLEFDGARADLSKVAAGKDEVMALEAAKLTGKAWLREGRTEEAIKVWDAVLVAHSNDEDLLEDLVETAAAESETAQALVYAGKLIEVSREPYQKTLRMLRRGDLLAQAGKSDEAVEAYAGTLNQVGEGSWLEREVLAQIERIFRKQDRLDDLAGELKKLAGIYPQRLLIHRQLAKLEAAQGETDAAIGRFREVLQRSPGEKELREEFVRLLVDGERFDEAVAELEKLIELAPADAGLYQQVAALRSRQSKPDAVLAALRKAHELLGKDEGNGIRIAGLMLQYGLVGPGESLLKGLAGPAAMEALAAQYGRTERKAEAVELLKKAGAGDDVDVLLRTSGVISALGESGTSFEILTARAEGFSADPRFLAALAQAALAAGKPADAVPQALKLVRLARQASELAESIGLASRVIAGAQEADAVRATLAAQAMRTAAETCLLATLIENSGDFIGVGKLLELDPDPLVIRFHAALLDRRGEFALAIAVMSRLADTAEGKKAAYFKDLSELQQRAGKIPEALATVERWKLAAPGDKSAWITGSRLLRESGKPEQAVKMTRQAVGRFEGDADLAASLASLHEEAGQWQEAEAIYWKLYDEGQSPTDQARWAAQLAQLAQRTGRISEMEEMLRERAKGNRRSTGPILALAELARVTENEDKRRDLLLEAVRLQPKDLDLRLQIATLEEKSGNPERVVAILEESLAYDVGGRARSALAQAYIRQGQAVKGMRELRLLSGKSGFDPRSAESAAAALAGTKLYDEAIGFLRAELPDGGDWRSRYLLGVLLEEDGREAEAVPIFLGLLQAQGEIPALVPPAADRYNPFDQYPEQVRSIFQWMTANQSAYMHRNRGYGRMGHGGATVGAFNLPNKPEDVRQFALIHLCALSKKKSGVVDQSIRQQIKATGIGNFNFIADLTAYRQGEQPDMAKLFETYPDQPGLFDMLLMYGGNYNGQRIDEKLIRRVLAHEEKLSPSSRFMAWSILVRNAKPEDPAWTSLLAAVKGCIGAKQSGIYSPMSQVLIGLLQGQQAECPEIHRPAVKQLLLDEMTATLAAHPESAHGTYWLSVLSLAGTPDAWLAELNSTIRESRKKTARPPQAGQSRTRGGQMLQYASRHGGSFEAMEGLFAAPTLESLSIFSLPMDVLRQFARGRENQEGRPPPVLTLEELVKRSAEIESPLLRAWLALQAGDVAALAKALAVVPPPEEAADFEQLRAGIALRDKQPVVAFAALLKARTAAGDDREIVSAINISLLAVAGTMTPAERASLTDELQATIEQCRPVFGKQGGPLLAAQARKLGLDELAKRLDPPAPAMAKAGAAAIAVAKPRGSSSRAAAPADRIGKWVAAKKYEAAAREIMQGIRSQDASELPYYYRNTLPELLSILGKDGQAELLKLADPGDSKSLVKRLQYAEICKAVGKPELELAMLEALAKERPEDAGVVARLVFAFPEGQADRRFELMTGACKADEFVTAVSMVVARLDNGDMNSKALEFFETVTRWLETASPESLAGANLSWVAHYGQKFFTGHYIAGLPSLIGDVQSPAKDKVALMEQRGEICRRLARAMLRHPSLTEEGFRLHAAVKSWEVDPAQKDEWARAALLAVASSKSPGPPRRPSQLEFFQLDQPDGGSSSGSELEESSSVAWLVKRSEEVAGIFPAEFIATLKQRNPEVGEIAAILSRELKREDLAVILDSDLLPPGKNRLERMLRRLILQRAAATPGAAQFFADRIAAIKPGTAVNPQDYQGQAITQALCGLAISAAAAGKPGEMAMVARAISRAVFDGKVDFSDPRTAQANYQRLNFMANLSQEIATDPVAMVRFQGAFFRLGVPLGNSESSASRPFNNKRFDKLEDAEKFLESLGWLTDAAHWEPYVTLIYQREQNGNTVTTTVEPKLALDGALQNIRSGNFSTTDLAKRLKDRKTGRFGSLMVAAALSSEKERSLLAGQAFTEFSADLAKLPAERVETFSLLLPWLTDDVRAKLPEKFQRKLRQAEAVKRGLALAQAEKFMATLQGPQGGDAIENVNTVLIALIPHDLDKAVEIFAAADDEFTESLGRGGKFSNSSSGDFQISERDQAFSQITQNVGQSSGPFASEPARGLKFLAKILASPSGKRLNFGEPGYYADRSAFAMAARPLLKDISNVGMNGNAFMRLAREFKALDAGLKPVALPCFVLAEISLGSVPDLQARQALELQIATVVGNDPQGSRLVAARLALWAWKAYTPEEKAAARTTLTALISDEAIPDVARLAMAVHFLAKLPKAELLDPAFSTALARLYQTYCGGERSAVSPVSELLFVALAKSPVPDDSTTQLHAALARAFWENASAAKAAGHPSIPNSMAQPVFITGQLGKDPDSIGKIFPRVKAALAGKLVPMISLMQFGQPGLARQLAPPPGEPFLIESHELRYTRVLEDSLAAFKQAGADKPTVQKLELALLEFPIGTEAEAPAEAMAARVDRLIEDFAAAPPEGLMFQAALHSLLIRSPGNARLLAMLDAWAKANPISGFLATRTNAAVGLHGIAAMHALACGDASLLKLIGVAIDVPAANSEIKKNLTGMVREMSRMIMIDVCAGTTTGYQAGLPVWNDFVVSYAEQIASYNPSELREALAASRFLADWSGESEAFERMCGRLPENLAAYVKQFSSDGSFISLLGLVRDRTDFTKMPTSVSPGRFIEKILCQPGFASAFSKQPGWVDALMNYGYGEMITRAIAANPPEGMIPEALPALCEYQGKSLRRTDPEKALATLRKGIDVCPAGAQWNPQRSALKLELSDQLYRSNDLEEARKMFDAIPQEEVSERQKHRYENLAKVLAQPPQP